MLLFYCIDDVWPPDGNISLVDLYPTIHHYFIPDLDLANSGLDFPAVDDADVHECGW